MWRFALVLIALATGPAAAQEWRVYENGVGTRLELPSAFADAGPGAADGSGARFRAPDGAEVRVYGTVNNDGLGLADVLRGVVAGSGDAFRTVTYQRAGASWFVLTGYRDGGRTIYYARYDLSDDGRVISNFEITYPAARRAAYHAVVTRMSRGFRAVPPA